jgi:glyoxylase-like metal-dependent hydrolase (beta-lactamase superfamily II)
VTKIRSRPPGKKCVIIDPVDLTVARDVQLLQEMGLEPLYAINTHAHADHITGASPMRDWLALHAGCSFLQNTPLLCVLMRLLTSPLHPTPNHPTTTGTGLLKKELPGLQSMISEASGAKADVLFNDGDKIRWVRACLIIDDWCWMLLLGGRLALCVLLSAFH